MKIFKLILDNETKLLYFDQEDVSKDEIISLYNSCVNEYGRRLTTEEFINELEQYGIYGNIVDDIIVEDIVL